MPFYASDPAFTSPLGNAGVTNDSKISPEKRRPGRPLGSKSKYGRDAKETIVLSGRPIEFLCQVVRGDKLKAGDPGAPGKRLMVWPTLAERMTAARILAAKVAPDLKSVELSGDPESPVVVEQFDDGLARRELAKVILSALAAAGPEDEPLSLDDQLPTISLLADPHTAATIPVSGSNGSRPGLGRNRQGD